MADQFDEQDPGFTEYSEGAAKEEKKKGRPKGPTALQIFENLSSEFYFVRDSSGNTYKWNGQYYDELTKADFEGLTWRAFLKAGTKAPDLRTLAKTIEYIKMNNHREGFTFEPTEDYEVGVENGVLNVISGLMRDHKPDDYFDSVLPIKFDDTEKCPLWLESLDLWFANIAADDKKQRIAGLQAFFGYVVLPRAKYKKALLLKGPGDTGKSVILDVMRLFVGPKFHCKLSVEHMDDPTKAAIIKGKKLNTITELSAGAILADGGFKTLVSTEEPFFIDRKFRDVETIVSRAKHAIATNNLPRLKGRVREIMDRLMLIPMDNVLKEDQQNAELKDQLASELPGILNWALIGAKELLESNGRWPLVQASDRVLADWEDDTDPFKVWFGENFILEENYKMALEEIAMHFNGKAQGVKSYTARDVGLSLRQMTNPMNPLYHIKDVKLKGRTLKTLIGWRIVTPSSDDQNLLQSNSDIISEDVGG